jgi:hypothetical protein
MIIVRQGNLLSYWAYHAATTCMGVGRIVFALGNPSDAAGDDMGRRGVVSRHSTFRTTESELDIIDGRALLSETNRVLKCSTIKWPLGGVMGWNSIPR